MADRIVVLRDGVVEQVGAPLELYDRPANLFVATFIGSPSMNLFEGEVAGGRLRLFDDLAMPAPTGATGHVTVGVRPDELALVERGAPNAFSAKVTTFEATGNETMVFAEKDGRSITLVTKARPDFAKGDAIWMTADPARSHYFDADGQRMG